MEKFMILILWCFLFETIVRNCLYKINVELTEIFPVSNKFCLKSGDGSEVSERRP